MRYSVQTVGAWLERHEPKLRRIAYPFAIALFAISLTFVAAYVSKNWPDSPRVRWQALALAAGVYLLSHLTSALSWPIILKALGKPIPIEKGILIGLIAQVGKYVPGNAAHYLGRALLAKEAGLSYRASGISTLVELITTVLAAALVGVGALFLSPGLQTYAVLALGLILLTVPALAAWSVSTGRRVHLFLTSILLLAISLTLSGVSFYFFVGNLWAVPAFALAWLIGFLLPGAPAGLGVREVVLVTLLAGIVNPPAITLAIVLHRLVTAVCDAIAATMGYLAFLLKKKKSANEV
jgi:glycosyltransferase 2 family protein